MTVVVVMTTTTLYKEYKLWMSPDSAVSIATGWTPEAPEFEFQ
jgi:hypothetical protein